MAKGGNGQGGGGQGGGGNPNQIVLIIVVNGTQVSVTANKNAPLQTVIPQALQASGSVGQGPDAWELKDAQGNLLDLHKKIGDYNFAPNTTLFLSLKAGVAGAS
jgi:hypothetical protein